MTISSRRVALLALAILGLTVGGCSPGGPSGGRSGAGRGEAAVTLSPAADPPLIEWRRPAPLPPAGEASPAFPPGPQPAPVPGTPLVALPVAPRVALSGTTPVAVPRAPRVSVSGAPTVSGHGAPPASLVSGPGAPLVALPVVPAAAAASRELVSIGLGGLWIGPEPRHPQELRPVRDPRHPERPRQPESSGQPEAQEDMPRVHYLFTRRQRADDLALFAREYAPFRLAGDGPPGASATGNAAGRIGAGSSGGGGTGGSGGSPGGGLGRSSGSSPSGISGGYLGGGLDGARGGELIFHGHGTIVASAAERRMIFEWARAVTVEAGGDGSAVPYGLALAWHRGASGSGVCDDLVVYLSGEVRAGSCGQGTEVSGRLQGDRLERLYEWVDGLAAFQQAGEQGVRADELLERLIFAGRGQRRASGSEIAAITAFAGSLHRELTGVAAGPSPASTTHAAALAAPPAEDSAAGAAGSSGPPDSPATAAAPPRKPASPPPTSSRRAPAPPPSAIPPSPLGSPPAVPVPGTTPPAPDQPPPPPP